NPVQQGPQSNEADATTYFPQPGSISVDQATDTSLRVNWTRPADNGVYMYEILRGLVAGQEFPMGNTISDTGGPLTFIDGSVVAGASYFYKVRVHDPVSKNVSLPTTEATGS